MDIQEVKRRKKALCYAITQEIKEFERETECQVGEIKVEKNVRIKDGSTYVVGVKIDVAIPNIHYYLDKKE